MSLMPGGVTLSHDEDLLLQTVREFARAELLPMDRAWDVDETSVAEVLPRLAAMGLLSLCLPEALGGLGCSYRLYSAILHEISSWSASTGVTLSVHNMVAGMVGHCAREPKRTEWLSHFSEPAHFCAFALSEAGVGSDAAAVRTTATEADGGFRVSGEKMWITNGLSARWFLTLVRLNGAPQGQELCALMIDGNEAGITRTKIRGKMGIRGSETAVIHFNNVLVPQDQRLGEIGEGLDVCRSTLNEGRIGIGVQAAGIAEACLNEMVSYARQREQFGQPIGKFQGVADMIAESAKELEAAKVLLWNAAGRVDAGAVDRYASSMAKLYATEAANRIAYRAVQIHGGTGYVHECRVEQLYRDARVTTIYEGTSEIQRRVIASGLRKGRFE